jgi:hypothetical protein
MFHGETNKEKIRLRGEDIDAIVGYVAHHNLQFYPENPRIYSIVYSGGKVPSQEEIYEKLKPMEHVKQLIQSIKSNDGLHDPVIVRDGVVLEGNSRLAAYRALAEKDPVKWGLIKAKVIASSTSESLVFALLGEYHLIGKKDWAPYEQAGYLYRRHHIYGVDKVQIAEESGLSVRKISHLVRVYKFMVDNGQDDVNKWSYYDEYLKSRDIKRVREEFLNFDDLIIEKINTGEICRAADVRDKLKVIARSNHKNVKKFAEGERDFDTALSSASDQGLLLDCFKKIHAFKNFICDLDTEKTLLDLDTTQQDKCLYEIKKIAKKVESLQKKLSG